VQDSHFTAEWMLEKVWSVATSLDHIPFRRWFATFMRSLPHEIIDAAHNADTDPRGVTVRAFILATLLSRYSYGWQPGRDKPCITEGAPLGERGVTSYGSFEKWGGSLEVWLGMEHLYRLKRLVFSWPQGHPMDANSIDLQITPEGLQHLEQLETFHKRTKGKN
jgi:hypothetical protein